jgi:hypothetical protein
MMRKETLDDIGGICGNQYPEDYDMVFRLYSHDVEIKAVPEVLHFWRDHGARASRNDPNYAQQDFVDLKLHYLLKCEDLAKRKVILWGAGRTGKLWAKALIEKEIDFSWVTDNEKKIGKDIYGVRLQKAEINIVCKNSLLLIAIKAPSFYEERNDTLIKLKYDHQIIRLY